MTDIVKSLYPGVKQDLYISNMDYTVDRFSWLALLLTLMATFIFIIPLAYVFYKLAPTVWIFLAIFAFFLILILCTLTIFKLPALNKAALGRKIEAEVAVTGRRLLIQLESGKSLVNAIIDVAQYRENLANHLKEWPMNCIWASPLKGRSNRQ